jgi:hypothetical protein
MGLHNSSANNVSVKEAHTPAEALKEEKKGCDGVF